jgi:hypothetical protein
VYFWSKKHGSSEKWGTREDDGWSPARLGSCAADVPLSSARGEMASDDHDWCRAARTTFRRIRVGTLSIRTWRSSSKNIGAGEKEFFFLNKNSQMNSSDMNLGRVQQEKKFSYDGDSFKPRSWPSHMWRRHGQLRS